MTNEKYSKDPVLPEEVSQFDSALISLLEKIDICSARKVAMRCNEALFSPEYLPRIESALAVITAMKSSAEAELRDTQRTYVDVLLSRDIIAQEIFAEKIAHLEGNTRDLRQYLNQLRHAKDMAGK